MNTWLGSSTFVAAVGSGLMSGLFFAFSSFVMRALARLPAAQGIAAMQSINATVLNPLFAAVFLGTAAFCVVVAGAALWSSAAAPRPALILGSLLYLVGVIGVTMVCNVPRNEALDAVAPDSAEAARLWLQYLPTWTRWNHVRTIAALGSTIAFISALRS